MFECAQYPQKRKFHRCNPRAKVPLGVQQDQELRPVTLVFYRYK